VNVGGLQHYIDKTNPQPVTMALTDTHPAHDANDPFSPIKGVNQVLAAGGAVPAPLAPVTATVATLLGSCDVAGFAEYLYGAATINNGWSRQSQYDAPAALAFVLPV
jgi:hypothetical protein